MLQKKNLEKDLAKIEGQQAFLEQQKIMIESAMTDTEVINAMKIGKSTITQLNKEANIDDIAEMKDELDDMMAENEEKQNYWASIGNEGREDLLAELDDIEAELAAKDLDEMDLAP